MKEREVAEADAPPSARISTRGDQRRPLHLRRVGPAGTAAPLGAASRDLAGRARASSASL